MLKAVRWLGLHTQPLKCISLPVWKGQRASWIQSYWCFTMGKVGEGNGNPLQYSCLKNPMDRGARLATVHGVAKSHMWLSDWMHTLWVRRQPTAPVTLYMSSVHHRTSAPSTAPNTLFSSIQFSRSVVSNSLWPHESQHTRPPCPSPTPGVYSNSSPSSWWCHPTISSSVVPFSSCPQSLPASGSFPVSQLFAWGGQSIGVSASTSVLPMNTQDWSPLGWTGWISL